jgi:hypothetical protein
MASLWDRLGAALSPSPALPPTLTHTGTTWTQASLFLTHTERGEPSLSVSFEIRRKIRVQEHESHTGLLGPIQSVLSQI